VTFSYYSNSTQVDYRGVAADAPRLKIQKENNSRHLNIKCRKMFSEKNILYMMRVPTLHISILEKLYSPYFLSMKVNIHHKNYSIDPQHDDHEQP